VTVLSVHHAQLPYRPAQSQAIRHFYGVLLGLRDISHPASDNRRYMAGSQRIELVPFDPPQPLSAQAHLAFEVLNLPELRHTLLDAGLPLDETRPLAGHRRFYVHDPAGNRLEFLEPEPTGVWTV
jgi:catechol 2,3-dioxygenase-like lactoylglutathione lyase family enzyme